MKPYVRARALHGIPGLIAGLGGDADAWFARFDLPLAPADDALVSVADMNLMLDALAADLACPDLALRLASAEDETILGPLAVALAASPTVAAAADCAARFLHVHCPAMTLQVDPHPQDEALVRLGYDIVVPGAPYPIQAMELGVALIHGIYRALAQDGAGPVEVQFCHAAQAKPQRYAEHFGLPVSFEQPAAGLLLPRRSLLAPLRTGNEIVLRIAVDYLARQPRPSASTAEQVRAALTELLGVAPATIGHVARLLAVHPRTLQRRLATEGTSFERVLDTVRRDTARELLQRTDLPFSQIAVRIGLADQSTLTRASRRWFGRTPREVRRLPNR